MHLLGDKEVRIASLAEALSEVLNSIRDCVICGNMDSEEICAICSSEDRDSSTIAVVETAVELYAMERSGFRGKYHVLGNLRKIPYERRAEEFRLAELARRCVGEKIAEVIIATNSTLEGQTTAYFIGEFLKDSGVKVTRPASGIPVGGELDYLDEGTLSAALNLRQRLE